LSIGSSSCAVGRVLAVAGVELLGVLADQPVVGRKPCRVRVQYLLAPVPWRARRRFGRTMPNPLRIALTGRLPVEVSIIIAVDRRDWSAVGCVGAQCATFAFFACLVHEASTLPVRLIRPSSIRCSAVAVLGGKSISTSSPLSLAQDVGLPLHPWAASCPETLFTPLGRMRSLCPNPPTTRRNRMQSAALRGGAWRRRKPALPSEKGRLEAVPSLTLWKHARRSAHLFR
jgi:hypothetical protein